MEKDRLRMVLRMNNIILNYLLSHYLFSVKIINLGKGNNFPNSITAIVVIQPSRGSVWIVG